MSQDSEIKLRKRPRQARAAATVDSVVEAAARIIESGGLGAFNTNAVAELAGVSIGSLYQYFPGKDAIMATLIEREARAFDVALTEAMTQLTGLGTAAAVARLAKVAVTHQVTRPGLSRVLDLEEQRLGLSQHTAAASAKTGGAIVSFLAERGLGGTRSAWDVQALSRGMIDGALDRGDLQGLEQRLTWAILGYLALSRQT